MQNTTIAQHALDELATTLSETPNLECECHEALSDAIITNQPDGTSSENLNKLKLLIQKYI
jgi:hypothetical protein